MSPKSWFKIAVSSNGSYIDMVYLNIWIPIYAKYLYALYNPSAQRHTLVTARLVWLVEFA